MGAGGYFDNCIQLFRVVHESTLNVRPVVERVLAYLRRSAWASARMGYCCSWRMLTTA